MDEKTYKYLLTTLKKYIPRDKVEDVLQEVLSEVYSKTELPRDIIAYVLRASWRSYNSNTSPYAKARSCFVTDELPDIPDDSGEGVIDIDKVIAWIDSVSEICWWEKELVKRKHLEQKSFKELSKEYGIPESKVQYSYYKSLKKLQNLWAQKES